MKFLGFILPQNSFQKGIWWNFLNFLSLSVSGILLNVLILMKYGTASLGAFNQVYAVYILVSQLAVFGIYASVLKHVSEYSENKNTASEIFSTAVLIGGLTAGLVTFIYWFSIPLLAKFFESSEVTMGLKSVSVGLWFFSINKIFLSFINGKNLMKEYAIFYIIRYSMLPLTLIVFIFLSLPSYFSPAVFTITEIILFFLLLVFVSRYFSFVPISNFKRWFKVHLTFGVKSFFGGGISEINSRVDVIMLGAFLGDIYVGIYSFAAMLAEGMLHIPNIFRINYNPILARLVKKKKLSKLTFLVKNFLKKWFWPSILISLFSIGLYFFIANFLFEDKEAIISWIIFAILMIGITIRSGYDVFWELPSQSGYPGYQTILIFVIFLSNVVLNFILILLWGIYGAAIEMILSSLLGIFLIKLITRKTIRIRI